MFEPIYLPEHVDIEGKDGENEATFSIYPYHPGYGPTVGNALRRVLLSSLPGAAITHVKIEGVDHEFTAIEGVREDIVSLILNLKKVRLSLEGSDATELVLKAEGKKKLTAADFEASTGVTIANPEQQIATLTDSQARLEVRCTVERGRGYVPAESRVNETRDIGTISIDALFTPVKRVSFKIENVRVGKETEYHKLVITIATDGTVSPKEALNQAASILADHFTELTGDFEEKLTADRPILVEEPESDEIEEEQPENTLNLLNLPSRVHNALERVGITTVEQVLELTDEQIQDIPGLGEKAVHDIRAAREKIAQSKEEE